MFACAVTASENGDIGRMDGKIGMGAPVAGVVLLVHVARLLANGRDLVVTVGAATVFACTGEGRGDASCVLASCAGTIEKLSLLTRDFRNQEGLEDSCGPSPGSLLGLVSVLYCLRPRNLEVEDFGRSGSTASAKNSCLMA